MVKAGKLAHTATVAVGGRRRKGASIPLTLHRCQTRRAPLIEASSVFKQPEPLLTDVKKVSALPQMLSTQRVYVSRAARRLPLASNANIQCS